jgi:hypothetical protein
VDLTLVGVAAMHQQGREYKKANVNLKHSMPNTYCPPSVYI